MSETETDTAFSDTENENTLPEFLAIERRRPGLPGDEKSFSPSAMNPSSISSFAISPIETLFIPSLLEISAFDTDPFLSSDSNLSLFIFLALSGLEKSIGEL